MSDQKRACNHFTFGEGKTISGQLVQFSAHPDDINIIKDILALARQFDVSVTGRVNNILHGAIGKYTRYDVKQHEYGGGGPGYIEVLEIKNPPDNRCGIVIHHYTGREGSDFFEFDMVQNAKHAWKVCWASDDRFEKIKKQKGFLRAVSCGYWKPWFYAVGNQMIEGDVVFMDIDREDSEFRFGQKFIVWSEDSFPAIKTCMGAYRTDKNSKCEVCNHIGGLVVVFWHDGTWWRSDRSYSCPKPKPVEEDQLWILEAMNKFKELLAGNSREFSIDFQDGSKFTGKWSPKDKKVRHAEGQYFAKIILKGGEIMEGYFDFKPTIEISTVEECLKKGAEKKGIEIDKIEVIKVIKCPGGKKKWSGVYPSPFFE